MNIGLNQLNVNPECAMNGIKTSGLIEVSMCVAFLWKPIDKDILSKGFKFSQLRLCSVK